MTFPWHYYVRSLFERKGTTLMTVGSIAFVVLVYIGVLSLAAGLQRAFGASGDSRNVIVLREGSTSETTSYYPVDRYRELKTLPGIPTTAEGEPLASGEVLVLQNLGRKDGTMSNVTLRGVTPEAFLIRENLRIVAGRSFQPGRGEVIVGQNLTSRFRDLQLGSTVQFGRLPFRVTGIFESGGSSFDSEVWGAGADFCQAFQRGVYYSSTLIRTASPEAARELIERIEKDQRLKLNALPEREYYAQQTAATARQFLVLGNGLAILMAFGACFAAANTMYASVAARTGEIAILRALGFKRRGILAGFLLESVLLGLVAGLVGAGLSLPLNGITAGTTNFVTFSEISFTLRTTPDVLAGGVLLAVLTGLVGGIAPAWTASRMPILEALRAA
jgi:putative ABC transport system permease protein